MSASVAALSTTMRSVVIGVCVFALLASSATAVCQNGVAATSTLSPSANTTNGTNATAAPGAAACSSCDAGYFGDDCDHQCTCVNGTCNDGIDGNGLCSACNAGYYGPNCDNKCTCFRGTCNDGPLGNGLCSECQTNFTGSACDKCKTGNYGPNCSDVCTMCENGSCLSTITGNGTCGFCFAGWAGLYCNVSCATCDNGNGSFCDSGIAGTGECKQLWTVGPTSAPLTPEPTETPDESPEPTIAPAPDTTSAPTGNIVQSISVTLSIDIADFSAANFSRDLASALQLNASNVEVIDFRSGSVIVTFRIVGLSADAIQAKYRELIVYLMDPANSPLAGMGITGYTVSVEPADTPEPTQQPSTDAPTAIPITAGKEDDENLSNAALIGIIVAAVVVFIVFAGLTVYCCAKHCCESNEGTGVLSEDTVASRAPAPGFGQSSQPSS